ncbi:MULTISPECIES: alpha/beta fold hydrolase [unclassified Cyanobium]|uniref:alpha/beta fold hydrolase n=1 Tax=unclassified Cyanobium TaxID=2627006 RepID=UPI0020CE25C5|nr:MULTISPECIES: alpha/beta hydrolase [unclassified Cyanobium]MCP9835160.1 alpha/beta hydrolase [Cyanobium sp. La Preciosa 7G6]MCP9937923.1 alpha/beta hydrolase [Cyanobium sp. Aljojuca 7A6]
MAREGSFQVGNRTLTYLETGDDGGPLVIHNHGGPSSRLEANLFDSSARAHGLRFVCVDRPGIGGSDPQPGRTFASWANDLLALADSFEDQHFAVTGWSEGGPWALAAAAYLDPGRLANVTCIAGASYGTLGANWAVKYQSSVDALGGRLALHFHPGFRLMYELLGLSATRFEASYLQALKKSIGLSDQAVLSDEEVCQSFLDASRECFHHGAEGLVADATMLYEAWPFDMTVVTRPVHFWQGTDDKLVPEPINRTVADKTPGAIWHSISGGGHFIALSHADEILAQVASDLDGHQH